MESYMMLSSEFVWLCLLIFGLAYFVLSEGAW